MKNVIGYGLDEDNNVVSRRFDSDSGTFWQDNQFSKPAVRFVHNGQDEFKDLYVENEFNLPCDNIEKIKSRVRKRPNIKNRFRG